MHVALLSREYPPDVYGGAGVHVEYLARELSKLTQVTVHCWGEPRPGATPPVVAHQPWDALGGSEPYMAALATLSTDLTMAAATGGVTIAHSHTWYANMGGHFAKLIHDIPHVATVHSLEPMRPWKAEQLGGGYRLSSFCERTALEAADAVIAVSAGHRGDIVRSYPAIDPAKIHVILNGIDTDEYRPDPATDVLEQFGIDPARPIVTFVGRITRQKGLTHLLDAARHIDPAAQLVLCAGAPDTPQIAAEIADKATALQAEHGNVIWIADMRPRPELIQILSHTDVFVCPSIYEPLGIVNLEAMACGAAVVASAVGGIPEVVVDDVTGKLVPYEAVSDGTGTPTDPDRFARDFAAAVNSLLGDPETARKMGQAGRARTVQEFSWTTIAHQTLDLYLSLS